MSNIYEKLEIELIQKPEKDVEIRSLQSHWLNGVVGSVLLNTRNRGNSYAVYSGQWVVHRERTLYLLQAEKWLQNLKMILVEL